MTMTHIHFIILIQLTFGGEKRFLRSFGICNYIPYHIFKAYQNELFILKVGRSNCLFHSYASFHPISQMYHRISVLRLLFV